jgi:EmrB/QacA subfamily drug resistance transporter
MSGGRILQITAPPAAQAQDSAATDCREIKRYLPWLVALALFMEQIDATILNTAVPSISASLGVSPLSLKTILTSYTLSLAVCIPISGWIADHFGTRRVFCAAILIFTGASALCGFSSDVPTIIGGRMLQGVGAAMMTPVGRVAVVRTFEKSELLRAMNFVVVPSLVGPLLGPAAGGLIVDWFSWREIFFVNIPAGAAALWLLWRYMPDYYGSGRRPLDLVGFVLFGAGAAFLSFAFHISDIGDDRFLSSILIGLITISLFGGYVVYEGRALHPLLNFSLFRVRTFRVSVLGGFFSRLCIGALPFLTPLIYQLGLGLPAWQSGLLTVPAVVASMAMKFVSTRLLRKFGYRIVLSANTIIIGVMLLLYSVATPQTPVAYLMLVSIGLGFFNSLQFTGMYSIAFADIRSQDLSMASTISSSFFQMSLTFGVACVSMMLNAFLGDLPQSDRSAFMSAINHTCVVLGAITMLSSISFWTLRAEDGECISGKQASGS